MRAGVSFTSDKSKTASETFIFSVAFRQLPPLSMPTFALRTPIFGMFPFRAPFLHLAFRRGQFLRLVRQRVLRALAATQFAASLPPSQRFAPNASLPLLPMLPRQIAQMFELSRANLRNEIGFEVKLIFLHRRVRFFYLQFNAPAKRLPPRKAEIRALRLSRLRTPPEISAIAQRPLSNSPPPQPVADVIYSAHSE